MKNFVFVSYYWGNYHHFAERWKKCCTKLHIDHYVEHMPHFDRKGSYQLAINHKPTFIKRMLEKFPNAKGVVYMDIDMIVQRYPTLFENPNNAHLMCFNWNYEPLVCFNGAIDPFVLETSGGLFYFMNHPKATNLLNCWERALALPKYKLCADDRVFAMEFKRLNLLYTCRVQWLPCEYFYIPQYFSHLGLGKQAVIVHDQDITTEYDAYTKGASLHRIPKGYTVNRSVRNKTSYNLSHNATTINHERRLKKHGFMFVTNYKFADNTTTTRCETVGTLVLGRDEATPQRILNAWAHHSKHCDILITDGDGNSMSKDVMESSDVAGTINLKKRRVVLVPGRFQLYMKKNMVNASLLKQWSRLKKPCVRNLVHVLNSNAHFFLANSVTSTSELPS